jgi:hypothetical protein
MAKKTILKQLQEYNHQYHMTDNNFSQAAAKPPMARATIHQVNGNMILSAVNTSATKLKPMSADEDSMYSKELQSKSGQRAYYNNSVLAQN